MSDKRQARAADAISPFLDSVQTVSVQSIETTVTHEWPAALGINIEAAALAAATYRGDQVVLERAAKFSANGFLAARFLSGGEASTDSLPTAADWMTQTGLMVRGSSHESLAFTDLASTKLLRGGPRLLQIGYNTADDDFPTSVEFPGGTRITETGAMGIGVGMPAATLHVASRDVQVRVENPLGGSVVLDVDDVGRVRFDASSGQISMAGELTVDQVNTTAVNVRHLHTSTQVLDSTLSLSGVVGFSAVSGYVMEDVIGTAWVPTTFMGFTDYDRDVPFTVSERVAEPGVQLFEVGQTVTFLWLDRSGASEVIVTVSAEIVAYNGRDPSIYPAQQSYTITQHVEHPAVPGYLAGGEVVVPYRAIAAVGGLGALSMINGAPLLTMSGPTIGQWHADYRGIKSENGLMTFKMGWVGGEGTDLEELKVVTYAGTPGFRLTSSYGLGAGTRLWLSGTDNPTPNHLLAFDQAAETLEINATSLAVNGTAVTLSSVVPNTAPAAGQILAGNAGGTAYAPVAMSGDATLASTGALTIAASAVTLAKMADMATASLLGRNTAGTGAPEVLSASTAKTILSLNNVENTALSTWAGSSSITTLGTIATGVWNAGKVTITPGSDVALLTLKSHSSQTVAQMVVQSSAGSELARLFVNANQSIAFGYLAGNAMGAAATSLFVGAYAGAQATGASNTLLGHSAGYSIVAGVETVAVGFEAGRSSTGSYSTLIGTRAGYSNTANNNTYIGSYAAYSQTSAVDNVAIGTNAMRSATAAYSIAIGANAGYKNTVNNQTFIGSYAGYENTTGAENLGIGVNALRYNQTGGYNVGIGNYAGFNNTASYNTFVGGLSGYANTSGSFNVGVGFQTLRYNQTSSENVAIGDSALFNATAGYNVGIGRNALYTNSTGTYNIGIGNYAVWQNSTGTKNVGIGNQSLNGTTGSYSVAVGYQAGYTNTNGGGVYLGYQAGYSETSADRLYIANSNTTTPLIYGEFPNGKVKIHGDLDLQTGKVYKLNGTQLLTARKTGWAAWTGTANRATKDTATATLADVLQTMKALLDDLIGHGVIGA